MMDFKTATFAPPPQPLSQRREGSRKLFPFSPLGEGARG